MKGSAISQVVDGAAHHSSMVLDCLSLKNMPQSFPIMEVGAASYGAEVNRKPPQSNGTFIPLPSAKSPIALQVYSDLQLLFEWAQKDMAKPGRMHKILAALCHQ